MEKGELSIKYCTHCGTELEDTAEVCPSCGTPAGPQDKPDTALNLLSFFIPLVGLILFLVYRDRQPRRAKAIGKFALFGVGLAAAVMLVCAGIFGAEWQRQREIDAALADADRAIEEAEDTRRQMEEVQRAMDAARRAMEDYYG